MSRPGDVGWHQVPVRKHGFWRTETQTSVEAPSRSCMCTAAFLALSLRATPSAQSVVSERYSPLRSQGFLEKQPIQG